MSHPRTTNGSVPLDPGPGLTEKIVALPDGRRLRTVVAGTGDGPLVVFEAGMSGPAAEWNHTQRAVSLERRTLAYDRAAYAGSDDDPNERTLDRIASDLLALLDAVGETDPVVLVGHSWGGPIMRVFADQHPRRVAGLVFVDATLAEVITPTMARAQALAFWIMRAAAMATGGGLVKRLTLPHGASPEISDDDVAVFWRDYACTRAMRAGLKEVRHLAASKPLLARLQEAGTPPVPTVCIQAGRVDRGMTTMRPLLNATATKLMDALPKGRVVVVEDAGHLIPQEQPAPVISEILRVAADCELEGR